ncbi:hypothetical protein M4R22_11010 [Acidovorax sp. GBBC 3334]|uniref:hypothetical protein n=1 Tax=Acidovorax sp. GBBC 3334 TaxID=2940496 RepID=UPI002303D1DE|nr:hypothetical protein [Acidovorax sp. GBBC 3334]MDA8455291.1 hypothetical protein [Acidovorax sp. GBBC 3334]
MNIEAISVFVKIDGRVVLAPIASDSAQLFMGMLPAFQEGSPERATVYVMPSEVADHVEAAGRALGDVLKMRKGAAHG